MSNPHLKSRDLMTRDLITARPGESLAHAHKAMAQSKVRHLPVLDDSGALVGILSERDLLAHGKSGGRISDHMRSDVKVVHPDSPAHEAAYLILRHRIGCVPVVDGDGRLVGLVSESDLVRAAYVLTGGVVPVDELEAEEREADHV